MKYVYEEEEDPSVGTSCFTRGWDMFFSIKSARFNSLMFRVMHVSENSVAILSKQSRRPKYQRIWKSSSVVVKRSQKYLNSFQFLEEYDLPMNYVVLSDALLVLLNFQREYCEVMFLSNFWCNPKNCFHIVLIIAKYILLFRYGFASELFIFPLASAWKWLAQNYLKWADEITKGSRRLPRSGFMFSRQTTKDPVAQNGKSKTAVRAQ